MFKKIRSKMERTLERLEDRAELLKARSHMETLERSHDIVLRELQKALNDEGTELTRVYAERYAFGLREGYRDGFVDGVHQYQMEVVKRLAANGIEVELEDWNA